MQTGSSPEIQKLMPDIQLGGDGKVVAVSFAVTTEMLDAIVAARARQAPSRRACRRAPRSSSARDPVAGSRPGRRDAPPGPGSGPFRVPAGPRRPALTPPGASPTLHAYPRPPPRRLLRTAVCRETRVGAVVCTGQGAPRHVGEKVFFYGTLMAGFDRRRRAGIDTRMHFVGRGWIEGALFDLGIFPAAIPSPGGRIQGEIHEVDDDPSVIAKLDEIEGFRPSEPDTSLYTRVRSRRRSTAGPRSRPGCTSTMRRSAARSAFPPATISNTCASSRRGVRLSGGPAVRTGPSAWRSAAARCWRTSVDERGDRRGGVRGEVDELEPGDVADEFVAQIGHLAAHHPRRDHHRLAAQMQPQFVGRPDEQGIRALPQHPGPG